MSKTHTLKAAYFSMEFALTPAIPNYAGGLGVLATDLLMSCADMEVPVVGVSLIYHQSENPLEAFDPEQFMTLRPERVRVRIEDREVVVGAWEYALKGGTGKSLPIYFLTTNFPENAPWDRDLTRYLYASQTYTRFGQEAILGIGGLRMLRELGCRDIECLHMNEGHCAFLTLEHLRECDYDEAKAKSGIAFTTHTPVPAGHDYFDYSLASQVLGDFLPWHMDKLATPSRLSMTHLALNLSRKTNAVARKHKEVCQNMFPGYDFEYITNGMHHMRWVSESFAKMYDKSLSGWKKNPAVFLKAVDKIPDKTLLTAKKKEKSNLVQWINSHPEFLPYPRHDMQADDWFDEETLLIAFARRFVSYKRPTLIFRDLERLRKLGYRKIQIVFAGKCHPDDGFCNTLRDSIEQYARRLRGQIRVAVVPDYNVDIGAKLTQGCDVWLNNPIRPREASGTSGMKAALNGGLNLSMLDGWWIEGYEMKPKSGWAFGHHPQSADENIRDNNDCAEMHELLTDIIHCYYDRPDEWVARMKDAISLVGYFNTHRAIEEYVSTMWTTQK